MRPGKIHGLKGRAPVNTGRGKGIAWIWEHIDFDGPECLIWPMAKMPTGYGSLAYLGKLYYPHRFMCELVNGPPPTPEHEAAHSCGNGHLGCVHPKHVKWKTISENNKDRTRHGRQAIGQRGFKLTFEKAQEIRALQGSATQREIAMRFGVSEPTVRDIFRGHTHKMPPGLSARQARAPHPA